MVDQDEVPSRRAERAARQERERVVRHARDRIDCGQIDAVACSPVEVEDLVRRCNGRMGRITQREAIGAEATSQLICAFLTAEDVAATCAIQRVRPATTVFCAVASATLTVTPAAARETRIMANVAGQASPIFSGFLRFLQSIANVSERTNGAQKRTNEVYP